MTKMTYGLNDISLIPARISDVKSRSQCNPYNYDDMLPLFTAPMNSIIDENNYKIFLHNKINTIIPRGVDYNKRLELSTLTFVALGLEEFEKFIDDNNIDHNQIHYICVDVANGHMRQLINLCAKAKTLFGNYIVIMAGNIANPETYIEYSKAGIDFVRLGIGNGTCCITSTYTGCHYGIASLIKDVVDIKWEIEKTIELNINNCPYKSIPLIIADGGFDNYDKIIKALALGADFVMIGKLFVQCEEACQKIEQISCICPDGYINTHDQIPQNLKFIPSEDNSQYIARFRTYYGMSTHRAQIENKNKVLKTEEGIKITVPVLYNLQTWCKNFISYLTSMMSYANAFNLEEFKNTKYVLISQTEYLSFNK